MLALLSNRTPYVRRNKVFVQQAMQIAILKKALSEANGKYTRFTANMCVTGKKGTPLETLSGHTPPSITGDIGLLVPPTNILHLGRFSVASSSKAVLGENSVKDKQIK